MPKGSAGLFIEYCAKDFLDGTQLLGPWEELAYRRICDLIYDTNNNLKDDDRMLAWATKTGKRWLQIKVVLTSGDEPKIVIVDGRLTNARCTRALGTANRKMAQKTGAGQASAATGKSLKNLRPFRTDVLPLVLNDAQNEHQNLPKNPLNQEGRKGVENGILSESQQSESESSKTAHTPSRYAYAGKIVRLISADYELWRSRFYGIPDFDARLGVMDDFYAAQPADEQAKIRKNWFVRLERALEKDHQLAVAVKAERRAQSGNGGYRPMPSAAGG